MRDYRSFTRRFILAAGLTAAVLGASTLGVSPAGADTPPRRAVPAAIPATFTASISPIQTEPGGHQVTVSFTTSEPTAVRYEVKEVGATPPPPPPTGPLGGVRVPITGGVATIDETPPASSFKTSHRDTLKNLKSNTTYDVFVAATTQSGQRLTGSARFTTLKERVRVTLEEINVEDDGDTDYAIFVDNDAEPRYVMELIPGHTICYPINCGTYAGNVKEGRFIPRDPSGNRLAWLLHEEVFNGLPNEFTIRVRTFEDDINLTGACLGPCDLNDNKLATATWRKPQGVESASNRVQVRGDDGDGFRSVLTFTFELFYDATPYIIN